MTTSVFFGQKIWTEREGLRPTNIGTKWGEMGQYRTNFAISIGFVTLFVSPKNDPKEYAYIDEKSLRVIA